MVVMGGGGSIKALLGPQNLDTNNHTSKLSLEGELAAGLESLRLGS